MVQMGSYMELMGSSSTFARLLEDIDQHEEEHAKDLQTQYSTDLPTTLDKDPEDEQLLPPENVEIQKKGSVKISVYAGYLRAGAGVLLGLLLFVVSFGAREFMTLYSTWWLAKWSEDEGHRYNPILHCEQTLNGSIHAIRSMSEDQWNEHRTRTFHVYCSLLLMLTRESVF